VAAARKKIESQPLVSVAIAYAQCRPARGAGIAVLDFEADRSDGEEPAWWRSVAPCDNSLAPTEVLGFESAAPNGEEW
jgi:hypothetical protein